MVCTAVHNETNAAIKDLVEHANFDCNEEGLVRHDYSHSTCKPWTARTSPFLPCSCVLMDLRNTDAIAP